MGLTLSACGLHVSSHGVRGNVFGYSFSASSGQLPSGFPSNVPVPDDSRVLDGGGADNRWDVAFAVTGSLAPGTTAYRDKLQSAGYTLSNIGVGVDTCDRTPVRLPLDHLDAHRLGVHRQGRPVDGRVGVGDHLLVQDRRAEGR